ncbi:alpha/beta hydrolase family protein [Paratissierella segnis]|uniref:S9 family peptidase n=1 Tax=Paratissierella segnis TaxID=2763679 RepID=A0A926IL38_9FIRM|nr:S9 family peptidase [Paratissierella segnis]MBC8589156.1 S9 family peptidase [Paratissierella segnis]
MEKLQLDDFTKYKFLSGIQFSPNGKKCGFVLHHMDLEDNKYLSNIYILDENGKYFKLTSMDKEKSFIWKDDSTIIFPSNRNKKDETREEKGEPFTNFYEINLNGGEANLLMEIPLNVTGIEILDDNTYLLTAVYDPKLSDFDNLSDAGKEKKLEEIKESKDYEILDEIPFWSNGVGFTNKKRNKLFIYRVKEKTILPITDDFTDVEFISLNSDKSLALIITNSFIDKQSTKNELNIYKIKENVFEKISPYDDFSYSSAHYVGDKILFTGTNNKNFGLNENSKFYVMDLKTEKSYMIANDFDYSLGDSVGSDCKYGGSKGMRVYGDYLYFITTEGYSSFINRLDIKGNIEKLTSPNGSINGFDIKDGKIYFIGLRGLNLQEIYALQDDETQLTYFNAWVNEEKKLSVPEKLTFVNDNNIEIDGWVLKPVDFKEGKLYPGILDIHGGPKTVYGEVFFHEMQYWANEGYFVFFLNPRGSDGRGNEFADIRGKYGTIDYDDIMNFVDMVLINYPEIDKDNIGVTGGSYGGFMTNWIIGHTERFKAAASQRSISNWVSFFGTTDIGYFFADDQNGATPWNDIDKLWFHSPLKYADRVTTPTLFIHSEEDYRCWLPEGLQMFTSLKYHGVDSRLCMFRGENHELSRSGKPKHRVKRLEEITNWFDKYLK